VARLQAKLDPRTRGMDEIGDSLEGQYLHIAPQAGPAVLAGLGRQVSMPAGLALSTDGTDVAWDGAALLLACHCS